MTIFAGVFSRDGTALCEETAADLVTALGRSGDSVDTFRDSNIFLAKVNIGAFDDLGLHRSERGTATALAGDPLYDDAVPSRDAQLTTLTPALGEGQLTCLGRCNGQFALAHWEASRNLLILATDFCGVRPVYYHVAEDKVLFATALHVLESVRSLEKSMDFLGVTEQLSFGYPLGNRTPYANIRCLGAGQALSCNLATTSLETYERMDAVDESDTPIEKLAEEAYGRFHDAIGRRTGGRSSALAFLSGGLDSRCVVADLDSACRDVLCLNILRPGRLDTTLARRFAEKIGLPLREMEVHKDERQRVSIGMAFGRLQEDERAGRASIIFSGDGGSVGTGHVYMTQEIIDQMRADDLKGASAWTLAHRGRLSRWALHGPAYRERVAMLQHSIETELASIRGPVEPGRRYHLFLMQNDQHRHVHHHYEDIDRYRTEFQSPFYDTHYLRLILSVPIEECLRHRFYHKMLEHFQAATREVPWQAYRGHLACPIPLPKDGARDQWTTSDRHAAWRRGRRDFDACLRRIRRWRLPTEFGIRRGRVLAALAVHALRLRSGTGMFRIVNTYGETLERSQGRVVFPEVNSR